jgi:hypothetical protein
MAADVVLVSETASELTLRVVNNSGHKLLSGYPEGRRIWLNVEFMDAAGVLSEVNPYVPLVTATDAAGNQQYVSGGTLLETNPELVWEAHMSSDLTSEPETFHFVLATGRHKDNRIPPRGFDIASAGARMTTPRRDGADAADYFTAAEYAGGYDEVTLAKPAGATRWSATLYYQTTTREYVEFLRNEINGTNGTLDASDYVVQSDPFFSTLKGWGEAMWDLWLHNGGSAPVVVTSVGVDAPCDAPLVPSGLVATAAKRAVSLKWGAVTGATSYNVYLSQGGKYALVGSIAGASFTHANLVAGQNYCYVVTSVKSCSATANGESGYSNESCAVPLKR